MCIRDRAYTIVETWQTIKAKARSNSYDTNALATILAEPELTQWRNSITQLQQEDAYYEYTLKAIDIKELKPLSPDSYSIIAQVTESRTLKQKGEIIPSDTIDNAQYQVKYEIIRQNDRWLIRSMQAL
jgi:hypothetical protein